MEAMEEIQKVDEKSEGNPEPAAAVPLPDFFARFNRIQITEHWLVMTLFTVLVVTGLPQRFYERAWAVWLIQMLGGIDNTRWVHRVSGILFGSLAVWHLGRISFLVLLRRMKPAMLPTFHDFRNAILTLKYYMGLSEQHARFDRYDFRQKFEYFGLVLGGAVMVATGLVLMYPVFFTKFLPGVIIPVSKIAHSWEAFMAFLVIIIWHMYGAHFSPEVFPGDLSIFTGKISRERLEKEHPLEYERILRSVEISTQDPHQAKEKMTNPNKAGIPG